MKISDSKYLIIFIILIIAIVGIVLYDINDNKKINVNRKVTTILGHPSNKVVNRAKELFLQAIKISDNSNFIYEKGIDNNYIYYAIDGYNKYKKITNFYIVTDTLTIDELEKFMTKKNIIEFENRYFIENYQEDIRKDYIGSIINFINNDDKYAYFVSQNYYCQDENYIGILYEEPHCDYYMKESTFKVTVENYQLKIANYEEIANLIDIY